MLTHTKEPKVMRDVIHGYIHIDLQIIWDLVDTKEMQRLRRIHQLGGNFQVYHTAEHSRFSHALGVYEIVRRMVYEIDDLKQYTSEEEKVYVMIAALLHDVGHFPFSHAFESIMDVSHEEYTKRILLENSEIHQVLSRVDKKLPQVIVEILSYTYSNPLLSQMISGQLDADRMDYLLRDAYFSGTSYGAFDLERILRTIRVKNNTIVVKESGIHSIEDYIMARYHMYWQVYYHPCCRSYEILLQKLFERMKYLYKQEMLNTKGLEMFRFVLDNTMKIEDHFSFDESAVIYGFSQLAKNKDIIIADLANRILNRDLFKYESVKKVSTVDTIREKLKYMNYDLQYYCIIDKTTQSPYSPYGKQASHRILVLSDDGEVVELSNKSVIVKSLVQGQVKEDIKVYYPKIKEEKV